MLSIRFAGQNENRQGNALAQSDGKHGASAIAKSEKRKIESTEDFELRDNSEFGGDSLGLNLIGFKVVRRAGYKVHFCTCCDFPIAVYGQMVRHTSGMRYASLQCPTGPFATYANCSMIKLSDST